MKQQATYWLEFCVSFYDTFKSRRENMYILKAIQQIQYFLQMKQT